MSTTTIGGSEVGRGVSAIVGGVDRDVSIVTNNVAHFFDEILGYHELFKSVDRRYLTSGKKERPKLAFTTYRAEAVISRGLPNERDIEELMGWIELSPKFMTIDEELEIIHQAACVIDDALDGSPLRRGFPTPNTVLSVEDCHRLGRHILEESQKLAERSDLNKYRREQLSQIRSSLNDGEIRERALRQRLVKDRIYGVRPTEEAIRDILFEKTEIDTLKTAKHFEYASLIGAEYGHGSSIDNGSLPEEKRRISETRRTLYIDLGWRIGRACQFTDEGLDVIGKEEVTGKPPGLDIVNGIVNMVHLMALQNPNIPRKSANRLYRTIVDEEYNGGSVDSKRVQKANRIAADYGIEPLHDLIRVEASRIIDLMSEISQGNPIIYNTLRMVLDRAINRKK